MLLALSSLISEIDKYSAENLGIPTIELMKRAGRAVAEAVRDRVKCCSSIVILAGKGNNGGDGYAAACLLKAEYDITVFDVFSSGQKTEEGRFFLEGFKAMGGRVVNLDLTDSQIEIIKNADCIIDAIFGTGFSGEIPENLYKLASVVSATYGNCKIAIDVPLGVNADNGSVNLAAATEMQATVALSFIKPGLVSFPAKAYAGEIIYDDLSLPLDKLKEKFEFKYCYVDEKAAKCLLPKREENSNKGSFGKLLMITGSKKYRGAAHLSLEAALRGGAGYVSFLGSAELCSNLSLKFPEAIYLERKDVSELTTEEIANIKKETDKYSAILLGSGVGCSEALTALIKSLLLTEGCPIILDADAINSLSELGKEGAICIKEAKRRVVLTPHPLEFARLSGNDVSFVQLHRIEASTKFAAENRCILVLKGAATIVTDGKRVYINSSGSSALAKAGSGDVLAGLVSSVIASGQGELEAAAFSVYVHGKAADALAKELSTLGVTPSDLPKEIARQICELQ